MPYTVNHTFVKGIYMHYLDSTVAQGPWHKRDGPKDRQQTGNALKESPSGGQETSSGQGWTTEMLDLRPALQMLLTPCTSASRVIISLTARGVMMLTQVKLGSRGVLHVGSRGEGSFSLRPSVPPSPVTLLLPSGKVVVPAGAAEG